MTPFRSHALEPVREARARRRPWQRRTVVALLAASLCAGVVGNALTLVLLRESPVALLVVHASYLQMGLASVRLDPVTFVAVAAVRRWLGEAVFFAAGRVIGTEVLAWYARRSGKSLRMPYRLNHRYALVRDAVVVVLPNPLLSAFFGVVGMPWVRYLVLKLVGSVLTVAALFYVTGFVQLPLEVAVDFLEANAVAITIIGAVAAFGWWWWQRHAEPPDDGDAPADAGAEAADSDARSEG